MKDLSEKQTKFSKKFNKAMQQSKSVLLIMQLSLHNIIKLMYFIYNKSNITNVSKYYS